MSTVDSRFEAIENRLIRIEQKLGLKSNSAATEPRRPTASAENHEETLPEAKSVNPFAAPPPRNLPPVVIMDNSRAGISPTIVQTLAKKLESSPPIPATWQLTGNSDQKSSGTPTTIMAVGAAISFLLAAAYFIGLIYSTGWLTPIRQVGIASVAGIAFIVAGILFSQRERQYSAYLPAVGVAILYLTSYAAFAMYDLMSFPFMMVTVAIVSLITTVVYYTAWGLLFSFMSLHLGRRLIYLVAMYMAIISFDACWRFSGQPDWDLAFLFQCIQFLIFASTVAVFAYIHKEPMSEGAAVAHGIPLFFFYITQVILLKQHSPQLVEIFGLSSIGVVIGLFFFGRKRLESKASAGATTLVSLYASVVTAHVMFLEILPLQFLPWAVLVIPVLILAFGTRTKLNSAAMTPVLLVTSILIACGLSMAFSPADLFAVPVWGADYILFVYAAMLYVCYWIFVSDTNTTNLSPGILYAGHIALLIGLLRLIENQLVISIIWAVLSVALLLIAIRIGDRVLGQSSLLIFIASGVKVVMFDLAGSPGPVRIGILIVLGASLYAGGWLYQSLVRKTRVFHPNKAINEQLRGINTLIQQGLTNEQIVQKLAGDKVDCLAAGVWTTGLVEKIRTDYQLKRSPRKEKRGLGFLRALSKLEDPSRVPHVGLLHC